MINYKQLSTIDLLKLVINENNNEVILNLVDRFGSLPEILIHSTEQELTSIKGISPKKAKQLIAFREVGRRLYEEPCLQNVKISCPEDIYDLVGPSLIHNHVENFKIILLNTKNVVTSIELISTGTLNASIVHPRDVFNIAIRKNANSIILIHNHPSGDPTPSNEDISITNRLIEVGNLVGIKVIDHLIVGSSQRYISFKEKNLI